LLHHPRASRVVRFAGSDFHTWQSRCLGRSRQTGYFASQAFAWFALFKSKPICEFRECRGCARGNSLITKCRRKLLRREPAVKKLRTRRLENRPAGGSFVRRDARWPHTRWCGAMVRPLSSPTSKVTRRAAAVTPKSCHETAPDRLPRGAQSRTGHARQAEPATPRANAADAEKGTRKCNGASLRGGPYFSPWRKYGSARRKTAPRGSAARPTRPLWGGVERSFELKIGRSPWPPSPPTNSTTHRVVPSTLRPVASGPGRMSSSRF